VNVGDILGQASALKSIGPVQFDLVVTHSVQKSPIARAPVLFSDCFGDSAKLGQKKIETAAAFLSRIANR